MLPRSEEVTYAPFSVIQLVCLATHITALIH